MYITVQYIDALLFVFEVVLFWEGGCMEVVCLFGFCSLGFEVVWEGGGLHPEKPPSYFLHYPSKSRQSININCNTTQNLWSLWLQSKRILFRSDCLHVLMHVSCFLRIKFSREYLNHALTVLYRYITCRFA